MGRGVFAGKVIEGVRLLPWVAVHERLTPSAKIYDCETCQASMSRDERLHLRCGWIPGGVTRETPDAITERAYGEWPPFQTYRGIRGRAVGGKLGPMVCPGYTKFLPEVTEVARFWGWEKRGIVAHQIEARGITLTDFFLDLADVFASEMASAESFEVEERTKRNR